MWVNLCFSGAFVHIIVFRNAALGFHRTSTEIFQVYVKPVTDPGGGWNFCSFRGSLAVRMIKPHHSAARASSEPLHRADPLHYLPFLHAWLTHNIQPVLLFIMSTLFSSSRSETSRQTVIYICHFMPLQLLHGFWIACFSCWSPTLTWRLLLHKSTCDAILPSREGRLKMENVGNRGALIQHHLFFFSAPPCKDGWVRQK